MKSFVKQILLFSLFTSTYRLLPTAYCLLPTPCLYAQQPTIIITEVLANALAYPTEFHEEFIELYNSTTYQINLSGWKIRTGRYGGTKTYTENLCPWNYSGLNNPYPVTTGTTVIQPSQYAVVISTWYLTTQQRYSFPPGTLLLTTTSYFYYSDSSLGYSISLSVDEAVTLINNTASVISTFGAPDSSGVPKSDSFPYDPGNGISLERINYYDYYDVDVSTNWSPSRSLTGSTPGTQNSVVPQDTSNVVKAEKIIEVFNSPFYPYGDHPTRNSARISYNVPKDATITLKIFDTKGNLIITPIDQELLLGNLHNPNAGLYCTEEQNRWKGTYYWGGRNESGEIVPIGVYICYIEAVEPDKGKVHKGRAAVVVGRKLD